MADARPEKPDHQKAREDLTDLSAHTLASLTSLADSYEEALERAGALLLYLGEGAGERGYGHDAVVPAFQSGSSCHWPLPDGRGPDACSMSSVCGDDGAADKPRALLSVP